ncbi:MAG: hypothetical protein IAG13_02640 [Deltaproteobacteria bacterium]|nr:hypothetical protein [Nannocystaceae bacterium]
MHMSSVVVARAAAFLAPAFSIVLACNGGGGGDGGGTDTDGSSGDTGTSVTIGTTTATSTTVGTTFGTTMTTTATTDTGSVEGPCCSARGEAGCSEDPAIAECVCETDRYCCETTWDDVCGDKVEALGCGVCEPGSTTVSTTSPSTTMTTADVTTGDPPDNIGPCCAAHPETGCEIPGLSECVCNFEPQCCGDEWDETCVDAVDDYGCGVCPPDPTTTTATTDTDTGPPPDNTEGCCITHASTGCEYPSIADCVCAANPECCIEGWSDACIDAVGDLGCGICPP